jgi:hypothetical protein
MSSNNSGCCELHFCFVYACARKGVVVVVCLYYSYVNNKSGGLMVTIAGVFFPLEILLFTVQLPLVSLCCTQTDALNKSRPTCTAHATGVVSKYKDR